MRKAIWQLNLLALFVLCPLLVAAQSQPMISGGVLNGKAISLPKPAYPAIARAACAAGVVSVQVSIDEAGDIISARAVSGHPLLQAAAVAAAQQAKFSPTLLKGEPVKVTGVINYNFVNYTETTGTDAEGKPKVNPCLNNETPGTGEKTFINGGVLNGKAIELVKPAYPDEVRAAGIGGAVKVRIVIDEEGKVISANAISGPEQLYAACVEAALAAKFSPTKLSGQPVKVSGYVIYNFNAGN